MIPDCTLTTACFDLTKYNIHSRNIEDTIKNMEDLLLVPCYLIIYTDKINYPLIKKIREPLSILTHYIIMDVEDMASFKYRDYVIKNREVYHPTKDKRTSTESHLIQSGKFELVLNSIELNPFNTSKFGWIDSNVGVQFSKICTNYKTNMLLKVLHNCNENKFYLQILNVCDKNLLLDLKKYYVQYRWIACGCLFVTSKDIGIKILTDLNNVFIKHTLEGYGHGEEMYYLEILDKYNDDLHLSYGDYRHILNNFIRPTIALDYIENIIIDKYLNFGYYHNCIRCCESILTQYENFEIEIHPRIHFNLIFKMYVSYFYIDKNKAYEMIIKINNLILINKNVENIYLEKKDFFDEQFNLIKSFI